MIQWWTKVAIIYLVLNMNYLPWNKFLVDATLATVCATSGSNLPKKSTVRVGMYVPGNHKCSSKLWKIAFL